MDALPGMGLPTGWASATLGELCDVIGGITVDAKRGGPGHVEVPYLRVANVQRGRLDLAKMRTILVPEAKLEALTLQHGDVLLNEGGDRDKVGRGWVWEDQLPQCVFQNHVFRARVRDDVVCPYFLSLYLNEFGRDYFLTGAKQTTNLASISLSAVKGAPVVVPPRAEQTRIVAAVNELFEEVEAGEAALARASDSLTQFRASLLHAACTGALTADWRAANPTNTTAEGGAALPPGWCTMPVSATGRVQLGRQRAPQHHDGPHMRPYLRVANVFEDRIDTTDVMSMNFAPDEFASYRLEPGDILLNEGQSAELVGRPAMFRGEVENCCFTNTLVRYRAGPLVNRDFALLVFRWWLRTGAFQRIAKITTNIAHLGAGRFGELLMPIPPLEEQAEIVRRAGELLGEVNDGALLAGHTPSVLRRSILHAAFLGRLVTQDPADEPATALLARLRATPAAARRPRARRTATQPDLIEIPA